MKTAKTGCIVLAVLFLLPLVVVCVAALFNGRVQCQTDWHQSRYSNDPGETPEDCFELRIMTYNIQDLWVVGRNRPARMRALAEEIAELDPDIVGFQEAFIHKERAILIEGLKQSSRLNHFHYFRSATVGSGLLVASAFPIREAVFHRYTVSGNWFKLWEGDWWAGKGTGLARVEHPVGGIIDFYDTHAQAGYGNLRYDEVRKQQMTELAQFIKDTNATTRPAFLVGDMNCSVDEKDCQACIEGANLLRIMNVPSHIDHIFARQSPHIEFRVLNSLEITERKGLCLSDHNGYLTEVRIIPIHPEGHDKEKRNEVLPGV